MRYPSPTGWTTPCSPIPEGYVARMEEEGIDRIVLDIYPPFDLKGMREVGRALFG